MHSLEFNDIDNLFKTELNKLDVSYDANHWEQLETELNNAPKFIISNTSTLFKRYKKIFFAILCVAIVMSAYYYFKTKTVKQKQKNTIVQPNKIILKPSADTLLNTNKNKQNKDVTIPSNTLKAQDTSVKKTPHNYLNTITDTSINKTDSAKTFIFW